MLKYTFILEYTKNLNSRKESNTKHLNIEDNTQQYIMVQIPPHPAITDSSPLHKESLFITQTIE